MSDSTVGGVLSQASCCTSNVLVPSAIGPASKSIQLAFFTARSAAVPNAAGAVANFYRTNTAARTVIPDT